MITLVDCRRSILLAAVAGASQLALSHAASAQSVEAESADSSSQIQEIVVTAQRRAENLQNVPIAITAVSGDTLSQLGVTGTQNLDLVAPSLNIATLGGGQALPRIRGVGSTAGTLGLENPVAVYVDNVYIAALSGALLSLNDIEQVAVLKGPQGTLFGRNATGGLIQVTTAAPKADFGGRVKLTRGNLDTWGADLFVTGGGDNVAGSLSVHYLDQDKGFGRNLVTGNDVNKTEEFAARGKIHLNLGEATRLKLSADYFDNTSALPGMRPTYGSLPIYRIPFTGGKFDISATTDPRSTSDGWGVSGTLEHEFSAVTLSSITAYRKTHFTLDLDADGGPPFILRFRAGTLQKQFSQEFQLASSDSGPLKWTAGLYYFKQTGHFSPPSTATINGGATIQTINANIDTESVAGYLQGTYAVAPRLNLTVGARYTYERRTADGVQVVTLSGVNLPPTTTAGRSKSSDPTWRLAVDYRFSDDLLGYASYNRGIKSGGFNPASLPFTPFDPEQLDAFEIGFKANPLDRRLRINPSAFYYKYDSIQVSSFVGNTTQLAIRNAAAAEIYGMDVDMTASVTPELTLTGGLALLRARFESFPGAQISIPNATGGNSITRGDASGNTVPNSPKFTGNIGFTYEVGIGSDTLLLNAAYAYNSGYFAAEDNRLKQPSYSNVNASASYTFADQFTVEVWGRNLSNEAHALQFGATQFQDGIGMSPGRTYGISLGAKF